MALKSGDVVQLKSGGPLMTVRVVFSEHEILCEWFDGPNRKEGKFEGSVLTVAAQPQAMFGGSPRIKGRMEQ
jgi:uncharacterized protein YodC (DUF2158 family)